ncbi:flagellar biosynthesis protein FlhB [Legionella dresdenensis]|uniref:Flagellar biosynthesis protein FlhB n=1 Tax=Legionella dresdenensis TaxID=450200 RepID=A0ABV8CGM6_9GAMM
MSEKTEKATPYKLKKAKEQGQVSKSPELTVCLFLLTLLIVMAALWPATLEQVKKLASQPLLLAVQMNFTADNISHFFQFTLNQLLALWLPLALIGLLIIILATTGQIGFVWTVKPLVPDFRRLNPISGFKRFFSLKLLFDAGKNILKIAAVSLVLAANLNHQIITAITADYTTPEHLLLTFTHFVSRIFLQIVVVLLTLSVVDKLYTRRKFAKDNRMSKQEVKDEYRQREGDPKIKSRIRQLQKQLRQKTASLERVRSADVVIANPTHLAIALKYDQGTMPSPQIVCKAQGKMVRQVKQIAARNQIPIIENKLFARALFASTDLNQYIREEHFPVAAMIFREIYQQRASR